MSVIVIIRTIQELEQEKREAEEAKRKAKQKSLLGFLQNGAGSNDDDQGSIEISLAGLFKCMLCTHGKPSSEKQQLVAIAESLEQLSKRLETIERYKKKTRDTTQKPSVSEIDEKLFRNI